VWERLKPESSRLFAVILVSAVLVVVLVRSEFLAAPVPNASAVTARPGLGVYWDSSCSRRVSSVDWGVLSPGQVRDVTVYVRNEGSEAVVLVLTPSNWVPAGASGYMSVALEAEDTKVGVGQVDLVTLSLSVSRSITNIYNFSFVIVLEGREFFLGDVNRNGVVDSQDLSILIASRLSTPADDSWNPKADLNNDKIINVVDVSLLYVDFGKSW
jgi:Dockerin type I domain